MSVRVVQFGSEMSQPFVDIALTNHGADPCQLRGYVSIRAAGSTLGGPRHPVRALSLAVDDGSLYERTDPGPHIVELASGDAASFSVGTATAYSKRVLDITRVSITPPGDHWPLLLHMDVYATAPPGKAIPVGVTALTQTG